MLIPLLIEKYQTHHRKIIKIIHFNVESISKAKSEILPQILKQHDVSVLCLPETHTSDDQELQRRGPITGYKIAGAIHHHQIATYVRSNVCDVYSSRLTFLLTVLLSRISITNVCKPPLCSLPQIILPLNNYLSLFVEDFNSHHSECEIRSRRH